MDSSLRVWSPKGCEQKVIVQGQKFHQGGIICLKLLPDNKTAVTGGADSVVIMSSIEDGTFR